jgi:hypothetical protein
MLHSRNAGSDIDGRGDFDPRRDVDADGHSGGDGDSHADKHAGWSIEREREITQVILRIA